MKLTELQVKRTKPGVSPFKLADGGGLYLLVSPNGSKLWRWKYRVDGKEKMMAFGVYPDVALFEVRDRHHQARKLLRSGVDPMAERKAEKIAAATSALDSFESVALAWH